MLTNDHLLLERNHMDGKQRIYRFASGMGLSLVSAPILHCYPFAWEAAVLRDVKDNGDNGGLDYSTSLTDDVLVFTGDEEANDFIRLASNTI